MTEERRKMIMRNKKFILTFALALCLMLQCFMSSVYASDGGEEILTVNAAWLDGEMLRINVTDANGVSSALALSLTDYVNDAENSEYISIQAVDLAGNKSGIVQLKNPYYIPPDTTVSNADEATASATITANSENKEETPQESQSGIPDENKAEDSSLPFTPSGAGTVIDNATEVDGKEFFTINSEDGSEFYLIIDRQKNFDNVYLLNAVTEQDLMALAEKNGKTITGNNTNSGSTSGIPSVGNDTETEQKPTATPTPEPETKLPITGGNYNTLIFVLIAVLVVGGAGYYFKIVKGKNRTPDASDDDDFDDDEPDDTEDSFSEYESFDTDEKEDGE